MDIPGPRARARNRILEVLCCVLFAAALAYAVQRGTDRGEFSAEAWRPFAEPGLWAFIAEALANNLRAAASGMLLSLAIGILLGIALLAPTRAVRWPARAGTEVFRSVPLLLLLYFLSLVLGAAPGTDLPGGLTAVSRAPRPRVRCPRLARKRHFAHAARRGTCTARQRYLGWVVQVCDTAWNE
jgi:His/Glu/Gln/Arg/opine family amino acid ABC transporter permease subunit